MEIKNKYNNLEIGIIGYENKYFDKYEELSNRNISGGHFIDKKDIMALSAIIGRHYFSNNDILNFKLEDEQKNLKILSNVDFSEYYGLIFSIALSVKNDLNIIFEKTEISKIFNNCAAIGFPKMLEIIEKKGFSIIENYEELLDEPREVLEKIYELEKNELEILEEAKWI